MRNPLICFCLLVFTFALYWQVRGYEFVNFDDEGYVTENAHILQGLNGPAISYAFHSTDLANYHPLTWLSYALDVSIFGARAGPMHLENALIHAINTALLFLFLILATGDLRPALFAALVFGVHPTHVESVAWIAERKDVLSGMFFLLALLAYLGYVRASAGAWRYAAYLATALLLTLGLLAKPMIVTFPFVLLLLDDWPLRRDAGWKKLVIEKLPLFAIALGSCIVTFIAQRGGGAVVTLTSLPMADRIANTLLSYMRYLGKLFWPSDLSIFYPRIKSLPMLSVIAAFAALSLITAGCWWFRRRSPFLLVGWLFFLGTLVPVIGIVQVGWQSIADRYLYLPMIGPIVMLTWSADALVRFKNAAWIRQVTMAAAIVVIALLSVLTFNHLRVWHDTRSLFNHALAVNPNNAVAHLQLGYLDARLGNVEQARSHYEKAIAIEPTYFVTQFDLANLLLNTHHPDEAVVYYQQAATYQPGVAKVENNWGVALLQLNRPREAFEHFRAAINCDPNMVDAHFNLGQLFLSAGRLDSAQAEFQATLNLVADHAGAKKGLAAVRAARENAG